MKVKSQHRLEYERLWKRRLRAKRKAANLCEQCAAPLDTDKHSCQTCLKYHKNYYRGRKDRGICPECKGKPLNGHVLCENCIEAARSVSRSFRERRKQKGMCIKCGSQSKNSYCAKCVNDYKKYNLAKRKQRKDEAYAAYGGYVCSCCGVTEEAFLSFDHINGDGYKHRKSTGQPDLIRWLKKENFPPGFQVLCFNCNRGKWVNGGVCPHKEKPLRVPTLREKLLPEKLAPAPGLR